MVIATAALHGYVCTLIPQVLSYVECVSMVAFWGFSFLNGKALICHSLSTAQVGFES